MSNIFIPNEDIDALLALSRITSEQKMYVLNELSKYKKGETLRSLANKIAGQTSLSSDESYSIVNVYFALIRSKNNYEFSDEDIIDSIKSNTIERFQLDVEEVHNLTSTTESLLSLNAQDILISSMGVYLASQVTNTILSTDLFAELKPIIANNSFVNMALICNLKLRYKNKSGVEKEEYFALDQQDIEDLSKSIEKLNEKITVLKSKFGNDLYQI